MKIVKRLAIFSVVALLFGTCVNPPEYSIIPAIDVRDVNFISFVDDAIADTLVITLDFKDGDGDLGLDGDNPRFNSDPFHEKDFYLIKDGVLTLVTTTSLMLSENETLTKIVNVPDGVTGKLVTTQTPDGPPLTCFDYNFDSLYVKAKDIAIFDMSKVVRTIPKGGTPVFYVLYDNYFSKFNENYRNIEVKFMVENNSNEFIEYDFRKELCGIIPFKDRFPILDGANDQLEGQMKYKLISSSLPDLFGGKSIQLVVQIKDRALHLSNKSTYTLDSRFFEN